MSLPAITSNISKERIDFLIESSRTSLEELIFRIKHRDDWLKIQLLAQITMLALAFGVEVGGFNATNPIPNVLALAVPTAFILASLYVVEDNLIGHLSRERGKLSLIEAQMFPAEREIPLFEASDALRDYAKTTLPIRLAAQLGAFVLIPAGLSAYRFISFAVWNKLQIVESAVDIFLWCVTIGMIVWTFRRRQRTGTIKDDEEKAKA